MVIDKLLLDDLSEWLTAFNRLGEDAIYLDNDDCNYLLQSIFEEFNKLVFSKLTDYTEDDKVKEYCQNAIDNFEPYINGEERYFNNVLDDFCISEFCHEPIDSVLENIEEQIKAYYIEGGER